jgi:uncharacterized protein DUF6933
MIFRIPQKLNTKIKAGSLSAMPPDENPYADWSAHLFTAEHVQYIILCNTKSLYCTVFYGKGAAHAGQFAVRALSSIREFMEADGHAFAYDRFITPSTGTIRFAKALSRSVTGSMNDLIFGAKIWLVEDGMAPFDVGFKLNETPLSLLPGPLGGRYGTPREAFKALGHRAAK